jgi:hypothetical protein
MMASGAMVLVRCSNECDGVKAQAESRAGAAAAKGEGATERAAAQTGNKGDAEWRSRADRAWLWLSAVKERASLASPAALG